VRIETKRGMDFTEDTNAPFAYTEGNPGRKMDVFSFDDTNTQPRIYECNGGGVMTNRSIDRPMVRKYVNLQTHHLFSEGDGTLRRKWKLSALMTSSIFWNGTQYSPLK
jgi:hypothetical protein